MFRLMCACAVATPLMAAEKETSPLPKGTTSFGAAVSDGYVYLYGGHTGKPHSYSIETTANQFLRLKIADQARWETLSGGPILQGLAVVAHEGKIYRIGGMQPKNKPDEKTDTQSSRSVARYDVKSSKWEDLPDLPEGRSSHDAVVIGDRIHVVGGWAMKGAGNKSEWHDTALVLDLRKQPLQWEAVKQPFQRRALTAAAHDGKVYVIGGLSRDEAIATRQVDIYDPVKNAWSKGPSIPGESSPSGAMMGFTPAACVCDGRLYLSPADGKVYRLTSACDAWEEVAALQQARFVHRVVPIGKNRMLAIGGSSKGAPTSSVELIEPKK